MNTETLSIHESARKAGQNAAHIGLSEQDCPYRADFRDGEWINSAEALRGTWLSGYRHALRASVLANSLARFA